MDNKSPVTKQPPLTQLRLLKEWIANPWFDYFVNLASAEHKRTMLTTILDFRMPGVADIFAREQLVGELRGVDWVGEQARGMLRKLQEKNQQDPPV